jgi:hypothetical protein
LVRVDQLLQNPGRRRFGGTLLTLEHQNRIGPVGTKRLNKPGDKEAKIPVVGDVDEMTEIVNGPAGLGQGQR